MELKDLVKYAEYEISSVEFYNEVGELEYCLNLWDYDFDDIDIIYGRYFEPYGIIKIQRKYAKGGFNGKGIQPPESKL